MPIASGCIPSPTANSWHEHAREHFEQAARIGKSIGHRYAYARALGNLGNICADLGDLSQAREYYEQSIALMTEIDDRLGRADGLFNLALTLNRLGETNLAIQHARSALSLFEEMGHQRAKTVRTQLVQWNPSNPND